MIKEIIKSSRPVSWINTAYPFAAGYLLMTGRFDLTLLIGSLYFLFPYNLLMYGINDVFDYESDKNNPRKGGIEGAVLPLRLHRPIIVSSLALNLPFVLYLVAIGALAADLVLALLLFFVVAYSAPGLRFKERPVIDSITSSIHFVGPLIYALVLAGWTSLAWPYVVAFFLWGMASHAFGAVQDINSDRQGRISSIATIFGARWTVRFSVTAYLLASVLLALTGLPGQIVAVANLLYVANVWGFRNLTDRDCEQANVGWRRFMAINMIVGAIITITLLIF